MSPYRLPTRLLERSFAHFRECGRGQRECQVFWTSPWQSPTELTEVVHPKHNAHGGGVVVDQEWISQFGWELAERNAGIRVQVHTHPRKAFHSKTDDQFPIIHKPGFLSLVIPNFGLGPMGFDDAFLTEIQPGGSWKQVSITERLVFT